MTIIDRTGVFYNPLQDQWNLSRDMDVNYMMLAEPSEVFIADFCPGTGTTIWLLREPPQTGIH
jgi:hypothetical protein